MHKITVHVCVVVLDIKISPFEELGVLAKVTDYCSCI